MMTNHKIAIIKISFLTLVFFLLAPAEVLAAKPRVWSKTSTVTTTTTATRPTFSVKLRKDHLAINVNFYYLNTANSVSYELTYLGNDNEQGVFGSVLPKEGSSTSRLLLFGTCSKNVCRYHQNIQNMQFKITAKLKSGKTLIKKYKVKV